MSRSTGCLTRVDSNGEVLLVSIASECLRDIASVSRFERELRDLAASHAELRWILDFGGRTFFITPAANTLLALMRRLRQQRGDLVLTGITQDVRYVMRLLRLDNLFTVYPDRESAQRALLGVDGGASAAAEAV